MKQYPDRKEPIDQERREKLSPRVDCGVSQNIARRLPEDRLQVPGELVEMATVSNNEDPAETRRLIRIPNSFVFRCVRNISIGISVLAAIICSPILLPLLCMHVLYRSVIITGRCGYQGMRLGLRSGVYLGLGMCYCVVRVVDWLLGRIG